jgi:hypothetical protein
MKYSRKNPFKDFFGLSPFVSDVTYPPKAYCVKTPFVR